MNITVSGVELNLIKDILGSAFISDKNRKKKSVKFEGWRAVAVKALLKELKEDGLGIVEKEDNETPIFQTEIKRKDENSEGWTWVKFAGKPNQEIRKTMVSLGYRYSAKNDKWYAMSEIEEETKVALMPFYNL